MFENLFKLGGELNSQQKALFGILGLIIFIGLWAILAEVLAKEDVRVLEDTSQATKTQYVLTDTVKVAIKTPVDTLENGEIIAAKTTYIVKNIVDADSLRGEHLDSLRLMSNSELGDYGLGISKSYSKLPTPLSIVKAVPVLLTKYDLLENTGKSLWINFLSYIVAILISIPIGFALGLIPLFRGLFNRIFDAFRFIPLAAVTFIFVNWFGLEMKMKVAFLAFGIMVYLIPVVVQRIDEVRDVYLKTVFTLGASTWDTIRTVYMPSVLSRLSDDIRVLTAISWTYITVAEMLNQTGGLGGLIFKFRRASNTEYAFVVLIVIILIGIFQDYILRLLDKIFFPYKYVDRGRK